MKLSTFNQKQQLQKKETGQKDQQYQSKFKFTTGTCLYQNQIKVQQVSNAPIANRNKIQISNKACKSKGKQLQKITIIRLNDRQIVIRDEYKFQSNLQYQSTVYLQRKSQLFKKSMRNYCGEKKGQKVTKNLAKNFIKAFFSFMTPLNDQLSRQSHQKLNQLQQLRYNNTVIRQILKNDQIRSFFKDFIQNKAADWINNSKIKDKQLHMSAVKMFQNMIDKKQKQSDKIKIQESNEDFQHILNPQMAHFQYKEANDYRKLQDDSDSSLLVNCGNSHYDFQ